MFSPVKAITVGALVFALGGAFLIAQPFGQQGDSAPAADANTDTGDVAATWVTGDIFAPGRDCSWPTYEQDGAVRREWGYHCEPQQWTTSDPRLSGDVAALWNADVHQGEYGSISVITAAYLVTNEAGGWTCRSDSIAHGYGFSLEYVPGETATCVGHGDYEGLSATLALDYVVEESLVGLIFPGDAPPIPQLPAALLGGSGGGAAQSEEPVATAFPTGAFEATDGHHESAEFHADGSCRWSSLEQEWSFPCAYAVNGDLYTEMTYESSMEYKYPATYYWDYDGEELTFELWGEDSNSSRYGSYANHAYSLAEGEVAAAPIEETGFPTGTFVAADGSGLSLVLAEDGTWSNSDGVGGAYGVKGDLWAEMTHDSPDTPQVPATYGWDWDGEQLTFEPWSRDDNETRVSVYTGHVYIRAEE